MSWLLSYIYYYCSHYFDSHQCNSQQDFFIALSPSLLQMSLVSLICHSHINWFLHNRVCPWLRRLVQPNTLSARLSPRRASRLSLMRPSVPCSAPSSHLAGGSAGVESCKGISHYPQEVFVKLPRPRSCYWSYFQGPSCLRSIFTISLRPPVNSPALGLCVWPVFCSCSARRKKVTYLCFFFFFSIFFFCFSYVFSVPF